MKRLLLAALISFSGVSHADPTLQNASLESNNVGGGYLYAGSVTATGWSFSGGAGISHDGTAWGGNTPHGDYFAFLQNTASLSQTFTSTAMLDYDFTFNLEVRRNHGTIGGQVVRVTLDDINLGEFTASSANSWQAYGVSLDNVAAGSHTLSFIGFNPQHYADTTTFLDNVAMTSTASVTAVPEPETYALMLVGLGLVGFAVRRR